MCQSKLDGGRRCFVHSPTGFVTLKIMELTTGLSKKHLTSILNEEITKNRDKLVKMFVFEDFVDSSKVAQEKWEEWLDSQKDMIQESSMNPRTLRAVNSYIERCREQPVIHYVYQGLLSSMTRAKEEAGYIEAALIKISVLRQKSLTDTRKEFNNMRDAVRGQKELISQYESLNIQNNSPYDTITMIALQKLYLQAESEIDNFPIRITNREVITSSQIIYDIGYDEADNRRLEIRLKDALADNNHAVCTLTYQNVPVALVRQLREQPDMTLTKNIIGKSEYFYATTNESKLDSVRRRCAACGQFSSVNHICPKLISQAKQSPQVKQFSLKQTPTPQDISTFKSMMDYVSNDDNVHIVPKINGENYLIAHLREDIQKALERQVEGQEILQYEYQDVTNGFCDETTGFGLEIEFMVPDGDVLEKISIELEKAGIAEYGVGGYHSNKNNGWKNWGLEEDSTVSAELVSPILYDTPESWQQIELACKIIKENGGYTSDRTGGHIHMGSSVLGNSIEKHAQLVSLMNRHEDVLFRIGSEPGKEHRPIEFCRPNPDVKKLETVPLESTYIQTSSSPLNLRVFQQQNSGHFLALNLDSSSQGDKGHIEFRAFDGTLDPAIIQARIMVCAAMMRKAAEYNNDYENLTRQTTKRIGYHHGLNDEQAHQGFLDFQSELFIRDKDKHKLASLYGVTQWQKELPLSNYSSEYYYTIELDGDY